MQKQRMPELNEKYVIVIGNIASGKSTATHLLSKKMHLPVIEADTLFQTDNPYREDFLGDMHRWALNNELWMTVNRVEILQKFRFTDVNQSVLVDSGLLMSWVYTFAHQLDAVIDQRDWHLYQQVFNSVSVDFLMNISVVYLDYSVPTLMERLTERGRTYELEYYTPSYLTKLQYGLNALLQNLKNLHVPVLQIAENDLADFEHDQSHQQKFLKAAREFLE